MADSIETPLIKNPLAIAYGLSVCALAIAIWNFGSYYRVSRSIDLTARGSAKRPALVSNQATASTDTATRKAPSKNVPLLRVNRSPQHLQRSAIQFARSKNLARPVRALYQKKAPLQVMEEPTLRIPKPVKKTRTRQSPGRQRLSAVQRYRDALTRLHLADGVPHFQYPIPQGHFWPSSPFGPRKTPSGRRIFHYGMDMAAVRGTLVRATASGVVTQACFSGGYGNTVVIAHDKKFKSRYAHMAKILVSAGDEVQAGDPIGRVGSTGNVWRKRGKDPSHLHFEIEVYGKRMNPRYFLGRGH
jgi:murein DD-endopeptidase MepM/ murein hydrolase activator NlpD